MRKRPLTEEEKKLWDAVARTTKPISSDLVEIESPKQKLRITRHTSAVKLPDFAFKPEFEIKPGNYAGIDKNTADRFRKGNYPLDGTIDLHGMTREKAYINLHRFLTSHYSRGSRCLLVITGKGIRRAGEEESERGILRHALPAWLSEPDFAPMVLSFDTAQQKHGGSGAFYILLKRKR